MLTVADAFEGVTKNQASVTEFPDRLRGDDRYGGRFFCFASIVDRYTAAWAGIDARTNSALGPALRWLLKSRKRPTKSTSS